MAKKKTTSRKGTSRASSRTKKTTKKKTTGRSSGGARRDTSADFLKASKKLESAWQEGRSGPATDFDDDKDNVEPGEYECRLERAQLGATRKKEPYASLRYVVTKGQYRGSAFDSFHNLADRTTRSGREISAAESSSYLALEIQNLGYETDELEPADLPALFEQLNEENPAVIVEVVESESTNPTTGEPYRNIRTREA